VAWSVSEAVDGTITATVAEAGSLAWLRYGDKLVELVLRGGRYAISAAGS
jgi:peptidoglycan biosynthesis protein MviN/MurJ (putative lipid II flippase)